MITPNQQAAKQATLGLALLAQDNSEYSETPPAILARKIQAREPLSDLEVAKIREFNQRPYDATPGWVMAHQLYGGQPLIDQIGALPVEKPRPKAYIKAGIKKDAQRLLQKSVEHPCDSVTLAEIGDLQALSEIEKVQAETVCETLSTTSPKVDLEAKWETQAVTAAGYETRVAFTHPELYLLKHQLDATLNRYEVPFDNTKPWNPHLTRAVTPVEPEQSLFAPFKTQVDRLILDWGGETTEFPLKGQARVAAVTAAATSESVLKRLGKDILDDLQKLDERWLTGLESIIEMAVNQALEKVGRSLKKKAPEVYMTVTASPMAPTAISVTADASVLEAVNVNQLIAAPIDDALKQAEALTSSHINAVQNAIGNKLGLDINLKTKYSTELNRASQLLKNRLKDWIRWRLCTPGGEAKLDDFNSVIVAPTDLVRDYAQTAGGDTTEKNDNGVYQPTSEANILPALGVGAIGLALLNRSFEAYKGKSSTQIKRADNLLISQAVKSALDSITPATNIRVGESYTWTPNYYGKIKTEHHPDHEPRFGDVVEDPREVTGRRPGDHPFCKCGWKPEFSLLVGE